MTTYQAQQRLLAAAWKARTPVLPDQARPSAPYVDKQGRSNGPAYDFCLPASWADLNLLPPHRTTALALFTELGVPWHAGVNGGPSNHLLSSQVQCVNALMAAVHDPQRLVRVFGEALGVQEVLPIEPGRFLTFEYIGPKDYFNESPGRPRVRGAHCTSVDAAFRHRRPDGSVELVLLEWKFTEKYGRSPADPAKTEIRRNRYNHALTDPDGPVQGDLLPFERLCDEPLYQLVRQQLLAHALEQDHAEDADTVRVVHLSSQNNVAYQQSLQPEHRELGDSVRAVWQRLLRRPDRFVSLDTDLFLDAEVTSVEYVDRYGGDAEVTIGASVRNCFSCGRAARWLVTHPYDGRGAGRLMAYCDDCRANAQDTLWMAMPLDLLWLDPDKVMTLLYEQDLTRTGPDVLAELMNLPGDWVNRAEQICATHQDQ